jgi:AcrR family transcriptional regulator
MVEGKGLVRPRSVPAKGLKGETAGVRIVNEPSGPDVANAPNGAVSAAKMLGESAAADRLLEVALGAWEQRGYAGISARAIALGAGQPASSIYYHFTDLEHLLVASQSYALELARVWCARQLAAMPAEMSPTAEVMPPLMAALIQSWSVDHRRLAFAWRECQLIATRNESYMPALHDWGALWTAFWEEICRRCGIPELARLSQFMFDGEGFLHLIQGEPVVDAACLIELCRGWGEWLAGKPAVEGPWRRHARLAAEQVAQAVPALDGDVAERIAVAAADLVAHSGPAGLTHRAVAAKAGLTLGAVSYHFRTSTDLVQGAFEMVYRRVMVRDDEPKPATIRSRKDYEDFRQRSLGREDSPEIALNRVALHELLVAVARDNTLKGFAKQLRYLRGRSSRNYLSMLLGPEEAGSPLEAALLSDISFGRGRGYIGLTPFERRAARAGDLDQVDRLLLSTRRSVQDN